MSRTHQTTVRALKVGSVAMLMFASACGGPTPRVHIGIREAPVNVRFGDHIPPAPPPVLGAPVSGFGPIGAPVRLDRPPTDPAPAPEPPACPAASINAPAEEAAPSSVSAAPKPGLYRFRRTGYLKVGEPNDPPESLSTRPSQPLSIVTIHHLKNVVQTDITGVGPRITYDIVQTEPGLRTTTSYLIDPVGVNADPRASAGLKITSIVLERSDLPGSGPQGVAGAPMIETFSPQPPVKIMNLPTVVEPAPIDASTSSRGIDPASNATMEVFSATRTRTSVDVCGRVIQGWQVQVSFPLTNGVAFTSTYNRDQVRNYQFAGNFVFAPQFGLIVQQDLTFRGIEVGARPFEMHSASTINSLTPA